MISAPDDDVVLRVYELNPDDYSQQQSSSSSSSTTSRSMTGFFARMLTPMGMGFYHTSIGFRGYNYTFCGGGGGGIIKTKSSNVGVPANAVFKETISLGFCELAPGRVNEIVSTLSKQFFTKTSYHLVYRNCNHFTETFATSLLLHDKLADVTDDDSTTRLESYPKWINRLAKSGASLGIANNSKHDNNSKSDNDDELAPISPCNILFEAKRAVGADEKVGWDMNTSRSNKKDVRKSKPQKKRELTPAQKAALAKLKGSKK